MKQLILDFLPPAPRTFDDFVRGDNAELLFQLGEWANGEVRALYIWGEADAGKSHLLAASAARLPAGMPVYQVNAREEMLPQTLESHAALLVDNVESLDTEQQITLFDHYNTLREGTGRILASGTLPPMLLPLRDDLTTRLGWGLVYQLKSLSDDDKLGALQRRARHLGFELPRELAEYLLKHVDRSLPNLYAQLEALNQLALSKQKPVTLPLLRESLKANT
ncbi:DnaA regulatory inactivator Hda [Chitinibacter sp. ZOR0017]|uniref:DnaA regulatory inactivator Hda n=1 Tax=Chitinibacter sp. ZOR0017 TaxID=1339254 RepID=UPI000646A375|nr:DnaA regulatory inactivator Hda [Chitinibacter sp. ZOR0017]